MFHRQHHSMVKYRQMKLLFLAWKLALTLFCSSAGDSITFCHSILRERLEDEFLIACTSFFRSSKARSLPLIVALKDVAKVCSMANIAFVSDLDSKTSRMCSWHHCVRGERGIAAADICANESSLRVFYISHCYLGTV